LNPEDPSTLRFRCTLSTRNKDISPVLDLERLAGALVENIVNDNNNGEDIPLNASVTNVAATATTSGSNGIVTLTISDTPNPFKVGDEVYVSLDINDELNGLVEVTNVSGQTIQYEREIIGPLINSMVQTGNIIRNGQALSRYMTRKVTLNPEFYASDIKVIFSAKLPTGCRVVPYYRVTSLNDPILEDNKWEEMVLENASSKNAFGYVEFKYKPPFDNLGESAALPTGDKYSTFSVKLVLLSKNPVLVPLVKDLRVLALDD
jgi:hypothetical protein